MSSRWGDSQLVRLAQQGDATALSTLMLHAHPHVTRFAYTLCATPQDAEDAAQEAIIILFRKIGSLRATAALASWMFQIVRNECLRLQRRTVGSVPSSWTDEVDITPVESAESQVLRQLEAERVTAGLLQLPTVQRSVLIMRDIQGLSGRDTANALGLTLAAMKSHLHRGRRELSTILAAG